MTFFVVILVIFSGILTYRSKPKLEKPPILAVADWTPKEVEKDIKADGLSADVKYGYKLLTETQSYLGPQAKEPEMRLSGNNLACTNCHLQGGSVPGAASWVGVTKRYPSFRGRSNAMGTIQDRINGCMERSMNGKKLDKDSDAMKAMVAYMEWLTEGIPEDKVKDFAGFTTLDIPDTPVDLDKGYSVFTQKCAVCHQQGGQGLKTPNFNAKGYLYPPLWGADSYNDGAGMTRVLTAATFIKANMPFGQATRENPQLTDEEAYNVAGYINSHNRPAKAGKENDFPDRKLKPVSTPYGPWTDNFSEEQHKFGPFPPIIKYYKEKYAITKSK